MMKLRQQILALLGACFLSAILLSGFASAQESPNFDVIAYAAQIEPDIGSRSVTGRVSITIIAYASSSEQFQLDIGKLEIDKVTANGAELEYSKIASQLLIDVGGNRVAEELEILVEYHGTPTFGINFSSQGSHVSTAFSTSQWMPSIDAPSEKATLRLTLLLPPDLKVTANGQLVSERIIDDGRLESTWFQNQPISSYLFGFAAGRFREVVDENNNPTLRYLTPLTFSEEDIQKIFRDTSDMILFFEGKAGLPYPGDEYTQVLLMDGRGQEMGGFSVMGERYGTGVLNDETAIWLGAHEVAHQWWGNGVTNISWNHFWLNEGIGTFMTAAYLEHRFGREEYMRNIDGARLSYERIRDAGNDSSLVFPDWDNPTAVDRSLVYDKGSYVIHLLRELLGEEDFWAGLQSYTKQYWGKSVDTQDFQATMEESSGQNLSEFFNRWVYLSQRRN